MCVFLFCFSACVLLLIFVGCIFFFTNQRKKERAIRQELKKRNTLEIIQPASSIQRKLIGCLACSFGLNLGQINESDSFSREFKRLSPWMGVLHDDDYEFDLFQEHFENSFGLSWDSIVDAHCFDTVKDLANVLERLPGKNLDK